MIDTQTSTNTSCCHLCSTNLGSSCLSSLAIWHILNWMCPSIVSQEWNLITDVRIRSSDIIVALISILCSFLTRMLVCASLTLRIRFWLNRWTSLCAAIHSRMSLVAGMAWLWITATATFVYHSYIMFLFCILNTLIGVLLMKDELRISSLWSIWICTDHHCYLVLNYVMLIVTWVCIHRLWSFLK